MVTSYKTRIFIDQIIKPTNTMFGLMKFNPVKTGLDQPYNYRQFYCGTCKTLGKSFGQISRMVLNHDAIFLGELLNDIATTEQDILSQSKAYESFNCFRLPKDAEIPHSLQYAAAANVLLAALSVEDHVQDQNGLKRIAWRTVRNALQPALKKANPILNNVQLPLETIYQWIEEQDIREKEAKTFTTVEEALAYVAEPTAQITGLVFQYGTLAVQKPELQQLFFDFGYQFGQLIYVIDAYEDFVEDTKQNQFNGLTYAFQTIGQSITNRTQGLEYTLALLEQSKLALSELPLSDKLMAVASHRLVGNTQRMLGIYKACCHVDESDGPTDNENECIAIPVLGYRASIQKVYNTDEPTDNENECMPIPLLGINAKKKKVYNTDDPTDGNENECMPIPLLGFRRRLKKVYHTDDVPTDENGNECISIPLLGFRKRLRKVYHTDDVPTDENGNECISIPLLGFRTKLQKVYHTDDVPTDENGNECISIPLLGFRTKLQKVYHTDDVPTDENGNECMSIPLLGFRAKLQKVDDTDGPTDGNGNECISVPIMTFKEKWRAVNNLSKRILAKGASLKQSWLAQANHKVSQVALATTMMAIPESKIRQLTEHPEIAESYTSLAYLPLIGAALIGIITFFPLLSQAMPNANKKKLMIAGQTASVNVAHNAVRVAVKPAAIHFAKNYAIVKERLRTLF